MNPLDLRTALWSYGLSASLCLLVMVHIWWLNRRRYQGLSLWVASYALQVGASGLAAGRGRLPDLLTVGLTNVLIAAGTLCLYIGLERFLGRRSPQAHNRLLLAALAGAQIYSIVAAPNPAVQSISLWVCLLIISAQGLWLLLRRTEPVLRPMLFNLVLAFGSYGLASLAGIASDAGLTPVAAGAMEGLAALLFQILLLAVVFSLHLAVNARTELAWRQAEATARESEKRFQTLVSSQGEGTGLVDQTETFLFANPAADDIFGVPRGALVGRNLREFTTPEQFETMAQQTAVRATGGRSEYELEITQPGGEVRRLLVTATPYVEEGGRHVGAFGVFRDITERQRAEEALRESERQLRQAQAMAKMGNFEVDLIHKTVRGSEEALRIYGFDPDTPFLTMDQIRMHRHPEDRLAMDAALSALLEGRRPFNEEYRLIRANDGVQRIVASRADVVRDAAGRPVKIIGVLQDITERKLMEEALRQSEARFQMAMEATQDGLWDRDVPTGQNYFSPAYYLMLGYQPNQLPGQFNTWLGLLHPDDRDRALAVNTGCIENQSDRFEIEFRLRAQDGSWKWILSKGKAVARDAAGRALRMVGTHTDITARKEMEEALRQSQEDFQRYFTMGTVGLCVTSLEKGWIEVNDRLCDMLGYTREELARLTWADLTHPDDLAIDEALFQEVLADQRDSYQLDKRFIHKSGATVFTTLAVACHRRPDRSVHYFLASLMDITARNEMEEALRQERALLAQRVEARTAELRQANADLQRANRLKDDFLATMSHELRTPLTAILGLAESLQMGSYGPMPEKQSQMMQVIRQSGQHLLALINDILDLSKMEAGKLELQLAPTAAADICLVSLQFVKQAALKKKIQLTYHHDPLVRLLVADPRRLKQMLVNLLNNAVKFTPEGGEVTLEVSGDTLRREVCFSVSDTGIGVPAEQQGQLFQPFVQLDGSLARRYEGTGLGLALTRRLAELHGGRASMQSAGAGHGSRFSIVVPWQPVGTPTQLPPERALAAQPLVQALGRVPVILLADDNDTTLTTIGDFLTALAARVITANSGLTALAQAQADPPDIILMDIQMPEMDGLEAIRRLRARPATAQTPIVAVTAAAMPGDRERCLAAGATAYVSKPISLPGLQRVIVELLKTAALP